MGRAARCEVCGGQYVDEGWPLCPLCLMELPLTFAWNEAGGLVSPAALASVPELEGFYPLCYFSSSNPVRNLVHQVKYQAAQSLGRSLGSYLAMQLKGVVLPLDFTAVVSLPLHWQRERWRGYNQSLLIGKGLAEGLGIPLAHLLRRVRRTSPQALHQDHASRTENVAGAFEVDSRVPMLAEAHLLLVDDVVTTGATARAAVQALCGLPGVRVSLASLGVVRNFPELKG